MAAEVTPRGNSIEVGAVHSLFRLPESISFEATPDGQRFLAAVPPEKKSSPPLILISNWPAALRK
jgi:hypothetical protein